VPLICTSCGTNDGELPYIWQVLCTFLDFFHKDLGTEGSDRLVNNDYSKYLGVAYLRERLPTQQLNNSTRKSKDITSQKSSQK